MNTRIALLIGFLTAVGQAPAQFEVASVKPNNSLDGKAGIHTQPGGRFVATNVTLRQLIRNAYQLQDFQIAGGPNWLDRDRFDILAKADGDDPSRVPVMLRALLADRFALAVHVESKELPIYVLMPLKSDGAPGPEVKRVNCDAPGAGSDCSIRVLPGTITSGGVTLAELARSLSPLVGRIVLDRAGLAGDFAFTLRWTPEQVSEGLDRKNKAMGLPPIDRDGPALVTAIREQLGLKLDAQKGPVDVLTVDRAERPKEN